jgi:HAMP domain-containing protein
VQLTLDYRRDLSEIDAEFRQIESSYVDSLANSMWSFDNRQTKLQLDGMLKIRDVQYTEVRGHAGEHFEAGHKPVGRSLTHQYALPSPNPRQPPLGTLTVVVGLDGVYGRLIDRSLVILTTQAIKTFLIALFILFIVGRWVTNRLERMARHARGLSIERLEPLALPRKPNRADDELDDVATALNDMSASLADRARPARRSRNPAQAAP